MICLSSTHKSNHARAKDKECYLVVFYWSNTMAQKRLLELDALRGIAALAVMNYHYFYRYNSLYGHENLFVDWSTFGQYGVHLFFIISGFVIFWTLHRVKKPADFIVSRISRLYPAYWLAVAFTFILVSIFGLPGREVSISSAIANLMMFHGYFHIPNVDGVYWTLTVELTFYFWIFLVYRIGFLNKIEYLLLPLVIASVLNSLHLIYLPGIILKLLLIKYIAFFLAGICYYRLAHNEHKNRSVVILLISLAATFFTYPLQGFILFLIIFIVFFLAISGSLAFLKARPLVFLGSISYSLYLIHQNLGYIIINNFYTHAVNPLIAIIVSMTISIITASIFFYFIEKPALKIIRNAYNNRKTNKERC